MGVSKCYFLEGWRGGGGVTMPPDLPQPARPVAVLPPRSCEDADTCSPPPTPGTADHTSGSNGGGLQLAQESPASSTPPSDSSRAGQVGPGAGDEGGVVTRGTAPSVPPVINTYYLTPELRVAFASVGATNSAYSFREVLLLLKKYLFSKVHLFDPQDRLYINCESDPLGQALGVKRFHFNDVRSLISQNIIKVRPARVHTTLHEPQPVPDTLSSSSRLGSNLCSDVSNDSTCKLSVPPGAASCIPVNETVASKAQNTLESVVPASSEPGPSRVCARERKLSGPSNLPPVITFPEIPDSCSDTETIYSVQGYETEYCRNTEYETSEEEEDLVEVNSETFEEYELPSDDAKDEKEPFSDCDSTIDDVEIAVLAYTLLQDEEEGFWADDDSSEDHSDEEDNDEEDPECLTDRWDCLTCGLKNKPFVRYCGKCWQLRKNWLPDRPKKRKRKPRPKKRNLSKGMASGPTEHQSSSQGTSSWEDHKAGPVSESSADDSSQAEELTRTSSASTTVSSSTQDSGFISSQDLLESQELSEMIKEPCVEERTLAHESTSQEASQAEKRSLKDKVQPKMLGSRKRKSSSTEGFTVSKRVKGIEEDEVPFGDTEVLARETFNFLASNAGKTWLSSADGTKFARSLQASPAYQESLTKLIAEQTSAGTAGSATGISMLCSICCLRPKNASIIHGRLAHQATCYQCARRLLNDGARCPVCRRKIHMVCKQIIA